MYQMFEKQTQKGDLTSNQREQADYLEKSDKH